MEKREHEEREGEKGERGVNSMITDAFCIVPTSKFLVSIFFPAYTSEGEVKRLDSGPCPGAAPRECVPCVPCVHRVG